MELLEVEKCFSNLIIKRINYILIRELQLKIAFCKPRILVSLVQIIANTA